MSHQPYIIFYHASIIIIIIIIIIEKWFSQQTYLHMWVTDILKFYEVFFVHIAKICFVFKKVIMLIFLCICIKHFQH